MSATEPELAGLYACFCEGDHDTLSPSQRCEPCQARAGRDDDNRNEPTTKGGAQ